MNELSIELEGVNPAELWGSKNENFEALRQLFPKLKIISRGTEVKALGEEAELVLFNSKFEQILSHFMKYNVIAPHDFAELSGREIVPEVVIEQGTIPLNQDAIVFGNNGTIVRARTHNQRKMVESSFKNDIIFAIGPAGTGKTYTAVALAVRALKNKEIKKIILTRPAVEAGENLGFLPGDMKEKIDPYLRPLYDALDDMIAPDKLKLYIENRTIEIAPLAFMRGRTLDNAYVILDEAQNTTDMQLKMFLTRMGPSAKFIVTGDVTQIDLPKKQQSSLFNALKMLEGIQGIDIIYLSGEDVVRHKLVKKILQAYGDVQ